VLILNGTEVARARRLALKSRVDAFRKKYGKAPGLAVVLVGDDPASQVYVKNKEKGCAEVGIASSRFDIDKKHSQEELDSLLNRLNADADVHGILVQIPLPPNFKQEKVLEDINPKKDADCLTYENMGLLWAGRARVKSCTPSGVMAILEHYKLNVAGKKAVVIGRSNIVGKPMAQLLMDAQATVTICHTKTLKIEEYTREADIVVVAAGRPRIFGREYFKKDVIVIDVGMHRKEDGKLCGDVKFEELEGLASAATPVPGGVGPMTITMLLENTLTLAEKLETERKR
jgi:methylenetetrahydrofolate dehydrogenase (NADP+) / methenyltetrahydrofolate cyclohydrolase